MVMAHPVILRSTLFNFIRRWQDAPINPKFPRMQNAASTQNITANITPMMMDDWIYGGRLLVRRLNEETNNAANPHQPGQVERTKFWVLVDILFF